ncbi:MAG: helix-turn-helix transcriptional regulator [Chloroflexi bacterium]|nr:helix-turn-helix transcriptional regulator [Chloroflexota bacterium]
MPAASRTLDRGIRLGQRALLAIGSEFETARRSIGVSQEHVATASRVSRPRYSRIENGKLSTLQVLEVARIASVLGLEPSFRLFPAGPPIRDAGQARRLGAFLANASGPLMARTEVPLPALPDRRELRAWDACLQSPGARTAIEFEMRLHDAQAVERRLGLKRRDDPVDHFILLIADTRTNRRVLAELPGLFADLPRLSKARVLATLRAGRHPGTGLVLV